MKSIDDFKKKNASSVLKDEDMKLVKGAVVYYCARSKVGSDSCSFFSTDSKDVADAWSAAWNANTDWRAGCSTMKFYYC